MSNKNFECSLKVLPSMDIIKLHDSRYDVGIDGDVVSVFGIENLYGNLGEVVDGINLTDTHILYTNNENHLGKPGNSGYESIEYDNTNLTKVGTFKSVKRLDGVCKFMNLPDAVSNLGNEFYYCDKVIPRVGGTTSIYTTLPGVPLSKSEASSIGLYACDMSKTESDTSTYLGCRLIYLP